jgi:glycine betaine/choline ABC-type transport system substrate-binding protein
MRGDHVVSSDSRWRALFALLAAVVLAIGVAACGDDGGDGGDGGGGSGELIQSNPDNEGVAVTVGSKNFTEQFILGEIYAQALQAAGYDVKKDLNLGSEQIALEALDKGEIDGYPEYTSTALTSFFNLAPEDVPSDPAEATAQSQAEFEKKGLVAFEPAPFNSANAVGTLTSTAEKLGLAKVSDLEGKSQDLTLYGSPECRQRVDCLVGLQDGYGLQFKEFVPVDIELRYTVLDKGQADLSILFTTDAKLFTDPDKYTILDDDRGVFPAGNPIFVARQETVDKAGPDFQSTIEQVQQGLTLEVMQELNARVDVDQETPADVAAQYLQEAGYVK